MTKPIDHIYDPNKAAYSSILSSTYTNPQIKQLYTNGHFYYVFKFAIVTNGLNITRQISFYDKDFLMSYLDIVVKKKSLYNNIFFLNNRSLHSEMLDISQKHFLMVVYLTMNLKV